MTSLGYTPEITGQHFVDKVNQINANSKVYTFFTDMQGTWSKADLVFPMIGLSINATAAYFRDWLPVKKTVVTGEFVRHTKTAAPTLYLRINGKLVGEIPKQNDQTEIGDMIMKGAELVLAEIEPYVLASYHYNSLEQQLFNSSIYKHHRKQLVDLISHALEKKDLEENTRIDLLLLRGELFLYEWNYDGAIEQYRKVVVYDPKRPIAYTNWAIALENKEQYNDAVNKHRKAIELDPANSRSYAALGDLLNRVRDFDCAVANFERAAALDLRDPDVYENWGRMMIDLEKYESAIEKFRQAIHLDSRHAAAYTGWGMALTLKNNPDAGIEMFLKSIEIEPNNLRAYEGLKRALRGATSNPVTHTTMLHYYKIKISERFRKKDLRLSSQNYDDDVFNDCFPTEIDSVPVPRYP